MAMHKYIHIDQVFEIKPKRRQSAKTQLLKVACGTLLVNSQIWIDGKSDLPAIFRSSLTKNVAFEFEIERI